MGGSTNNKCGNDNGGNETKNTGCDPALVISIVLIILAFLDLAFINRNAMNQN